jgi:hypothetical protein
MQQLTVDAELRDLQDYKEQPFPGRLISIPDDTPLEFIGHKSRRRHVCGALGAFGGCDRACRSADLVVAALRRAATFRLKPARE